jgi:hypothetical protein
MNKKGMVVKEIRATKRSHLHPGNRIDDLGAFKKLAYKMPQH